MTKKCGEPLRRFAGGTWHNYTCGAPVVAEYTDESPADPADPPVWHPVCVDHRRARLASGRVLDIRDAH
jgi:hypothetical protein